jgi:hypothetical protein
MRFLLLICACSVAYGQAEFLPQPRTVHRQGVVVDVTTGEPIADAVITVTVEVPRKGTSTSKTTTDFAGRFQVDAPYFMHPIGGAFVVSKPGYVQRPSDFGDQLQDASGDLYQRQVVLGMLALATVTGVVVDAAGKPSPGARIDFISLDKPPNQQGAIFAQDNPAADAQGRFEAVVLPGSYHVCATPQVFGRSQAKVPVAACFPSASDYASAASVTAHPGGAAQPLTIHLLETATYSIRGRIKPGTHNRSDWGIQIWAVSDDHTNTRPGWAQSYSGCVNRGAKFVIAGVPAGAYTLSALAGPGVQTSSCGARNVPKIESFAIDDCCSSVPQPRPVRYSGQRKATLNRDLSGIVVNVVADVQ